MKSENPNFFVTRSKVLEDVKREIFLGEGERTEFKSCLRMNLHTCQPDHKIEFAVLRSIASFLNSSGGSLFLGVSDNKEILGLEKDGFENLDLFNRHLTNLLKENIGAEFLPFLSFDFFNLDGKVILRINCMKSIGPVFLKSDGREDFFVRFGASTISLSGNRMLEYIRGNF
jgi:predicted HTH transcriptional regulator